jgi:hypothetical protein
LHNDSKIEVKHAVVLWALAWSSLERAFEAHLAALRKSSLGDLFREDAYRSLVPDKLKFVLLILPKK